MGFDLYLHLISGFKLPLSAAIDAKLINADILQSDDYQLIHEPDCRDMIIDAWVTCPTLRSILTTGPQPWNLYILTSSQEDADLDKSFLFLFNKHQALFAGSAPDYTTDAFDTPPVDDDAIKGVVEKLVRGTCLGRYAWTYQHHWVLESSW